ncbi:MAG: DUF72 domain-containing protein [Actinobacteria bacterium]|nr:DUF72 domain-containing protein [Actinomycetota bacterium]
MPAARDSTHRIRIGCSGWNYAHWRNGVFYPPRCAPRNWLGLYARSFDTVEINTTFYRLPKVESVARWVAESPADFTFAVKVSRYVTHIKRLLEVQDHLPLLYDRIGALLHSPKLGPLLWQLPPTFACDLGRLATALEQTHDGRRHAFEFRHPSWFRDETYVLLREHGAALVIGDRPQVNKFQTHELTADFTFVRFHGGTRSWNGNYSHAELDEWAARLQSWSSSVDVFVYFNNDWEGYAIENALYLKGTLGQPAGADETFGAFDNAAAAQG